MMVSSSIMSSMEEDLKREETKSQQNSWANWKRGGIIGAAALTGGTLLAVTGGMATANFLTEIIIEVAKSKLGIICMNSQISFPQGLLHPLLARDWVPWLLLWEVSCLQLGQVVLLEQQLL